MGRYLCASGVLGWLLVVTAPGVQAWSGGPAFDVTDLNGNCSVCHSSMNREQVRTEPAGFASAVQKENRHYKAIEDGTGPYQGMSAADRQKLLADVKVVDENASVAISMPTSARPGQEIQITVTVKGGNEVMGVYLVDTDLRYQGRPIQADGWLIVGPPKISGSDGKEQTKWPDMRAAGFKKNINAAMIYDRKADLAAKKFPEGKVTWTVKAPQEPGTYTVTAGFNFGTEKASSVGGVTTPTGAVVPKGGLWGNSGRMLFAKPVTVTVR